MFGFPLDSPFFRVTSPTQKIWYPLQSTNVCWSYTRITPKKEIQGLQIQPLIEFLATVYKTVVVWSQPSLLYEGGGGVQSERVERNVCRRRSVSDVPDHDDVFPFTNLVCNSVRMSTSLRNWEMSGQILFSISVSSYSHLLTCLSSLLASCLELYCIVER